MARGRMHNRGEIHMVTNRCEEGRFFLKPSKEVLEIISYWFARAVDKYGSGIEIYAFCFLCNHFHMLCKDNGELAKFMGYFQSNVAKAVNRELGRGPAHFWQGPYDDQIIEGERTFWQKYLYIVCNAVKSGLVSRVADWKGFCSFKNALSGKPIIASGLNRTRFHNANRGNKKRKAKEFVERFEFNIAIPPGMEHLPQQELAKELRLKVKQAERHYTECRDRKSVLGMDKVLNVSHFHKPRKPDRRPRSRFACDSKSRETERMEEYRRFIGEYKRIYSGYIGCSLRGFRFHSEWPRGSFPPSSNDAVIEEWAA